MEASGFAGGDSLTLSISVGTAGGHVAVLQESSGKFSMLGRPCYFSEKMSALGTVGDVLFVDPSQWSLGLRKEVSLDRSQHVGWATHETCYRALLRADIPAVR